MDKVVEQRLHTGLHVSDRVLDCVEVCLDLKQKLRKRTAMLGRQLQKKRQRLLLQSAASSGDLREVVYHLGCVGIAGKSEHLQLVGEPHLQVNHVLGFRVAHKAGAARSEMKFR